MNLNTNWQKVLEPEMNKPYFVELMAKINQFYDEKREHIFPEKSKCIFIFSLSGYATGNLFVICWYKFSA